MCKTSAVIGVVGDQAIGSADAGHAVQGVVGVVLIQRLAGRRGDDVLLPLAVGILIVAVLVAVEVTHGLCPSI